jgi:DNA polymerase V
MIALVDCNNFYPSCERLFNPRIVDKPVVVLSNNDGCVIARSYEAKDLGIKMGTPAHMIEEQLIKEKVAVFSSNYALYGELSRRVMLTLKEFVPEVEVYSIDEAFCKLDLVSTEKLHDLAVKVKSTVKQNIGIPVSVGIAPTKTLAKLANRYAKKVAKDTGVYVADTPAKIEEMLKWADVSDVWGIGSQNEKKFKAQGYHTAYDLLNANEDWIRDKTSVVGLRLLKELKGLPCYGLLEGPPAKKMVSCTRSFGQALTNLQDLKAATATYAGKVGQKLRREGLACSVLYVFVMTNEHRPRDMQYSPGLDLQLPVATNNSAELISYAMKGLELIYKPNYRFKKSGVVASGLVPVDNIQTGLFDQRNREKDKKLMGVLDNINVAFGKESLRYAVETSCEKWRLRAAKLSPVYTRWTGMPQVR